MGRVESPLGPFLRKLAVNWTDPGPPSREECKKVRRVPQPRRMRDKKQSEAYSCRSAAFRGIIAEPKASRFPPSDCRLSERRAFSATSVVHLWFHTVITVDEFCSCVARNMEY